MIAGSDLPIFVPISDLCGGIPAKSCCSWGAKSRKNANGITTESLTGARCEDSVHAGIQRIIRDLNRLYVSEPALHERDCEAHGFQWTVGDDRANSVFSFLRYAANHSPVLVVCNVTPVPRHGYRIGVSVGGVWREIFNSDSSFYSGSNLGNQGRVEAQNVAAHGQPYSVEITLPPLATIYLRHDG